MAKNRDNNNPVAASEDPEVMDRTEQREDREERTPTAPAVRPRSVDFFRIYKPNQGKRIRLVTGIAAGVLLAGSWEWMFRQMRTAAFIGDREWLATLIALGICAAAGLVVWYLVGVRPGSVDFLVATESEMKKVTWSSRKEVWGATKVVIGMVVMMAAGLFVVDLLFTLFFSQIGVLKSPFGS